MAEKLFTDNTTGKLIIGTVTTAFATATGDNIADITSPGNAVKILDAADTAKTFKISYVRTVIIKGTFTGSPLLFLWLKVGTTGKMIMKRALTGNQDEFRQDDLLLPAGSEIYAGFSALPGGAGSELNVILKLAEYE